MVCSYYLAKARAFQGSKRPMVHYDSLCSGSRSGSGSDLSKRGKNVVIVMDGLKDFNMEILEWALENIVAAGCIVTLLGLMPWLNIPLSSKTWRDVWMLELEDASTAKDKNEWKIDCKYLKLQALMDLCKKYGVLLQKKVVMGYPPRLLVVERINQLHATWVVFDSDKYHKKNSEFYAKRIQCNMVMMTEEGDVDMIKGWPMIDNGSTPAESTVSLVSTPKQIISRRLKVILEENELENCEEDYLARGFQL